MKKLLPLFLLLLSISPVYADEFESTRDGVDNGFVSTISYGINMEKLPKEGIEFSMDYLDGEYTSEGLGRKLESYTTESGMHLLGEVKGSFVYVPPESTVDILYHYKNNSEYDINISEIVLSLSNQYTEGREWVEDFASVEKGKPLNSPFRFTYLGVSQERYGVLYSYPGIGVVKSGEEGVIVLESVEVKDPLEVVGIVVEEKDESYDIAITIRKRGEENMTNISYAYGGVEKSFDLGTHKEGIIKYSVEKSWEDSGMDIRNLRISHNHCLVRCAVIGVNFSSSYNVGAVSVFSRRDSGEWESGLMMGSPHEWLCMLRIPYTKVVKVLDIGADGEVEQPNEPEDLDGSNQSKEIEDAESVEGSSDNNSTKEGDVLGISSKKFMLPKTGVENEYVLFGGIILLVVDAFLWYSVSRRKYEKKNLFTKICSKNWKNSHQRRV